MTETGGNNGGSKIHSDPGQPTTSPGKRILWMIGTFLILSAVGGILVNAYLETNDSAYTASGVVQLPPKPSGDPLHPNPPDDPASLKGEVQAAVARFRDENLVDDLLKDPTGPLRKTQWWNVTCDKDPEKARDLMQRSLAVEPMPESNLIKVSFSAPVKADSAVIVTAVVDQTINAQRDFIRNKYDAERRLTAEYKNGYEIELRNAMADVASERDELIEKGASPFGVPGGAAETELAARLKERIELQSTKADIDIADAALKEMREHGQVPPSVQRNVDQDPDIIHARQMLDEFDVRLLADGQNTTQPTASLRELWQHKLDQLKATKLTESLAAYSDQIASEKKNVGIKLDNCNGEITRLQAQIADIAGKTAALKSREADMQTARDRVEGYSQHLLYVDQQLRSTQLGEMDWFARPHVPTARSFPNLASILGISIGVGLILGLIVALVRELARWGRG